MKSRIFSVILAMMLLVTILPISAVADNSDTPVFEGTLSISENAIEMIKDLEGYTDSPKHDYSQHSIGYGCSTAFAEKYGFDPEHVTKAEAHELMLFVLDDMETHLEKFLDTYNIHVNQYQYDALMSLTYNLGKTWMKPNSRIGELLISDDYTVNEMASAFAIYCHVGRGPSAKVDDTLVSRRILEAKLFLFGAYDFGDVPEKFCRLTYLDNIPGEYTDVAIYQEDEPYQILFEPDPTDADGDYFAGWYTEDGEHLTPYDIVYDNVKVRATWSDDPADEETELIGEREQYTPRDNPPVTERDYSDGSQQERPEEDDEPAKKPEDYVEVSEIFKDLNVDQWHYDYVNDLYNEGIINGYEDSTFRPERTVSCGEALKMILLAADYPEQDATGEHWASGYYDLAIAEEIIDETDFKGSQLNVEISRQTMAKIVARSMQLEEFYDCSPFSDTDNVYACILYFYEITEGYEDGTFRPDRSLTRAELSTIVWRIYNEF